MSKEQQIKGIISRIQSLPTLPQVVQKLTTMVESPDVTAQEVGKLISSDQVLGAKVLRLVNSPFYGFPGRISSITHSIILLGFNVIKGVVLSASVFDLMEQSMVGLWEHSLGSAIIAGSISRTLGLAEPEEIATACLLHDIGKVLVRVSLQDDYEKIAVLVNKEGKTFREAELEILGVDHAEVGGWLAHEWNLPDRLAIPIEFHHNPAGAKKFQDRVAVVNIADGLVRAWGIGSGGDPWATPISREIWESTRMSTLDLDLLMAKLKEELEEVEQYQVPAAG
jgi:putative nucleotidyltransferase with HDIG domain